MTLRSTGAEGPPRGLHATARIDAALENALRRERWIVRGALVAVVLVAWAYLLAGAGMSMTAFQMTQMSPDASPGARAVADWTPAYAALMFGMWSVMMVAMMLPSASPMILLFAAVHRRQRERGQRYVSTALFALAYVGVWVIFSALATLAQWTLAYAHELSLAMAMTSTTLAGALLVAAGAYQLTPAKQACLRHCRAPLQFVSSHWRPGARGALLMGATHGAYCVGCCWFLMALLFVGGVMNLYWIAGLALLVLLEKLAPPGRRLGQLVGIALVLAGCWQLAGG